MAQLSGTFNGCSVFEFSRLHVLKFEYLGLEGIYVHFQMCIVLCIVYTSTKHIKLKFCTCMCICIFNCYLLTLDQFFYFINCSHIKRLGVTLVTMLIKYWLPYSVAL